MSILWNLVIDCNEAKEQEKLRQWSLVAITRYEKHLKLFPDDEDKWVHRAVLLHFAGRDDESKEAAQRLEKLRDGKSLFNAACLQCALLEYGAGLDTFRKAIEAGYRGLPNIKQFLNEEEGGIGKLKGTPEYEIVTEMVEKIELEGKTIG
jgi:hypothetical protein